MRSLEEQVRALSSGTLASVSGLRKYEDIDRFQMELIDIALGHPECVGLKRWQDVVRWYCDDDAQPHREKMWASEQTLKREIAMLQHALAEA